jgi:hypothetical protein
MSGFSEWLREAALRASAGGPALALPETSAYLALCTAQPLDSHTGSTLPEASYPGYHRIVVPYAGMWAVVAENTLIENLGTITGPTCTGGEALILGWATLTAATAGHMLWSGSIPHGIIVTPGDPTPIIPPGVLKLNLASGV